jgi:peptidoglycan hydrolase-like protein with peptidoglycan-binding domain
MHVSHPSRGSRLFTLHTRITGSSKAIALSLAVLALLATPAFATRTKRTVTGSHSRSAHKPLARSKKVHGQQAIDPARVTEIQTALIREHYLTGEADGRWSPTTEAAMQKFQSDQGWQTKLMPDSRALKKLGLGPDYSGAINAKSANFAAPPPVSTIPTEQAAGFTQASGVNQ